MTRKDLVPINPPKRFARGCYRGELVNADGYGCIGNVYVESGQVFIGEPRPYGHGEIDRMAGPFSPRDFTRAGGMQISASQRVKFWRFKTAEEIEASRS